MTDTHTIFFNPKNRDSFDLLKAGKKSREVRACGSTYDSLKEGDTVVFTCGDDSTEKRIEKVEHFDDIDALLSTYQPEELNPDYADTDAYKELLHSFPGYKDRIEKNGVFVFTLAK